MRASFELQFGALREVVARERREHCRGEPGNALLGGYASDSARAEGSSIVDEPRECWTPVRENQSRKPGGF